MEIYIGIFIWAYRVTGVIAPYWPIVSFFLKKNYNFHFSRPHRERVVTCTDYQFVLLCCFLKRKKTCTTVNVREKVPLDHFFCWSGQPKIVRFFVCFYVIF